MFFPCQGGMARVLWKCVEQCVVCFESAFEEAHTVGLAAEMVEVAVASFCCSLGMKLGTPRLGLPFYLQPPRDPPEEFVKVVSWFARYAEESW